MRRMKYNWQAIQEYYDRGFSFRETMQHFGFAIRSWTNAVKRGDIIPRLSNGRTALLPYDNLVARSAVKKRLLKEGVLPYTCAICSIGPMWQGVEMALELDHINGVNNDNRLENLRFLCPNCHAIQSTNSGKNKKRKLVSYKG